MLKCALLNNIIIIMRILLFLSILDQISAYTVAIAGAHGGLGRELVQQSLEHKCKTIALVRRPSDPIFYPCRDGWLSASNESMQIIQDDLLEIQDINNIVTEENVDALIIAIGEKPFKIDTSADVTNKLLNKLSTLKKVCLVSAHGVGDDKDANIGITAMRNYYLKNVQYDAKLQQEYLVNHFKVKYPKNSSSRVLSYGSIPFNDIAVPRNKSFPLRLFIGF